MLEIDSVNLQHWCRVFVFCNLKCTRQGKNTRVVLYDSIVHFFIFQSALKSFNEQVAIERSINPYSQALNQQMRDQLAVKQSPFRFVVIDFRLPVKRIISRISRHEYNQSTGGRVISVGLSFQGKNSIDVRILKLKD